MFQLIWNGLFVGSFYALVALGYSMVYGIIKPGFTDVVSSALRNRSR